MKGNAYLTTFIAKRDRYFGSGASASKKVFVSAQLRDKMLEYKLIKLNWFVPCKDLAYNKL